ncbi:hypothetical protein FACS189472_12240 [Alphaproteobacteria bacterium]|nr:hypothetical protein FACS189472_12240 [Alphaproteobacteria bacterium]
MEGGEGVKVWEREGGWSGGCRSSDSSGRPDDRTPGDFFTERGYLSSKGTKGCFEGEISEEASWVLEVSADEEEEVRCVCV